MESQQASAAAANTTGGKHEYGMFSGPMKLGPRVEDYREIFECSGTSSIPVLDVPELNERRASVEPRSSRLDYSKIFGGLGEADIAMPYDNLISRAEKDIRVPAESRSQFSLSGHEQSTFAERKKMSAETSLHSLDDGKNVNVLYHQTNSRGRMGRSGMTHVAQFHAVPGFTHLIDENVPSQSTEGAKSGRYVLNDVHLNLSEEMKETRSKRRAYSGPLLFSNTSGQQHTEHHRTSSSVLNELLSDLPRRSHPSAVSSQSPSSPLCFGNEKAASNRSMKSKLGSSKSAAGYCSPPFLDDEVDANSTASASAAAVRKAIEEAEAKILFAKELMERRKQGRHNRSKQTVNHGLKSDKKLEAISAEKSYKYKEEPDEMYRRDDALKRQVVNFSPAQNSREVRQVNLDFRDQKKDSIAVPSLAVNHQVETTFTKVDSRLEEIEIRKTPQDFSEASISKGLGPSMSELSEEDQGKNVIPSSYENKWKEKMKTSFLQDKFENIMKMLRAPEDVPDVEDQLMPERISGGQKGNVSHVRSEVKQEAACTKEEIEGRSNEGTTRKEDESTVEVNSWLNNMAKGHKEEKEYQNDDQMEKKQSFDRMEDDPENTSDEIDGEEPSKVRFDHFGIENEGRDRSTSRDEEVVIEKVEEIEKGSVIGDDPINPISSGREGFSHSIDTKRIDSADHQRLEGDANAKVAQEPPGFLDNNVEVCPALHEREESENAEQINEAHKYRELAVTVNDRSPNPFSGSRGIEKQSEKIDETYNFDGEEDCTRVGPVNSTGFDGIGNQQDELPDPLIVDENGVCSSGIAFNFKCRHTEDGSAKSEGTYCPENHAEEATRLSGESKDNADDAEVGSTDEDTASNLVSLNEVKVLPNGEEAGLQNHVGGASGELEDHDKDNVNNGKSAGERELLDDGMSKRTSQEFSKSEKEEPVEAAVSSHEKTTNSIVDDSEDAYYEALQMQETEKQRPQLDVEVERQQPREKEVAKERDLEKEKERRAVERAIREARERAFTEAREKAEKSAAERAAAEAQRRVKAVAAARERSEKASTEAKLKAERAAVERATAEARERALEKALSDKASLKGKNCCAEKSPAVSTDDGRPIYEGHKSSGYNTSSSHSSSTNTGVPNPAEISGNGSNGESSLKSKASLEKQQQMAERAAKALAEKNMRDLLVQKEQAERNRLAEVVDAEIKRWSSGKERNLRVLLSTLHYILGPDSGWQAIARADLNSATAVRKAYKKATLFVHPDKLQQRGASIRQKYVCEKVFELLKDAWNRFSADDR
ncbi:Auxilin-like protein 1 [Linum grandiflorum]